MFAATWGVNGPNWVTDIGISGQGPIISYIYSFYFCATTILTIGYGDISPVNLQ